MSDRPLRLPPNRMMVKLYHTPLAPILGRMFLLLTTRGRRSGVLRTSPQYEAIDNAYDLGAARGLRADRVRNIQADRAVELHIGRHALRATARVVTEAVPIADFLEVRLRRHPLLVGAILRSAGLPRPPARADLEAYSRRLALVILTPARAAGSV